MAAASTKSAVIYFLFYCIAMTRIGKKKATEENDQEKALCAVLLPIRCCGFLSITKREIRVRS